MLQHVCLLLRMCGQRNNGRKRMKWVASANYLENHYQAQVDINFLGIVSARFTGFPPPLING